MPDCTCDPTFPTSMPPGADCPNCLPYHIYSSIIAAVAVAYAGRISKKHWALPGGTYRNYAFSLVLIYAVMRVIRHPLAALLLALDKSFESVPALFWDQMYILPIVSLAASALVLSINWRVILNKVSFSEDLDIGTAHARAARTVLISKFWVFMLVVVEVSIYTTTSLDLASQEIQDVLSTAISPMVIGVFALVTGAIGNTSGRGLRRILSQSDFKVGGMLPERMTTLVIRYSIGIFSVGLVSALGGLSALLSDSEPTTKWLLRNYIFRMAEICGAATLMIVYKLPQQALKDAVQALRASSAPKPGATITPSREESS